MATISDEQLDSWLVNRFGPDYKFNIKLLKDFLMEFEPIIRADERASLMKEFGSVNGD